MFKYMYASASKGIAPKDWKLNRIFFIKIVVFLLFLV